MSSRVRRLLDVPGALLLALLCVLLFCGLGVGHALRRLGALR